MASTGTEDSYAVDTAMIKDPPKTLWGTLRHLGPSLILTANIVGSGELIMTTTLGATVGFVTLWVILLSCLVKVTVQLEFGKFAISSGQTTFQALNELPGPRYRGICWSIWMWFVVKGIQFIQYGGIVGGVALALNIAVPSVDVWIWAWVAGLTTMALVFKGHYQFIERFSIFLIAIFTFFTIFCVIVVQATPYRFTMPDIIEGMSFQLPAAAIGVAIAAFGLTGVSADEIISYPYWCIEKGYARFAGPREDSAEWVRRAKGWIRVMYIDSLLSMVLYTVATAAFYVLGASILHRTGQVPAGYDTIRTLSQIYTESAGPWAMVFFLVGAVVALFSTLFVACASGTRMFTDAFAQCGFLDFANSRQREKWFHFFSWFLPLSWTLLFLTVKAPVFMVMAGGLSIAVLLVLVVYAAYVFRYHRLCPELKPGRIYDMFLWISFLAITGVGVIAVANLF